MEKKIKNNFETSVNWFLWTAIICFVLIVLAIIGDIWDVPFVTDHITCLGQTMNKTMSNGRTCY